MLTLSRRQIIGGLILSLSSWFGLRSKAAAALPGDGFVIVNGWVLKRSDLDHLT